MAEGSRQRSGQLVRGLFSILRGHPDGLQASDALARLAESVPPTEWEASDYPNRPGVRRYEKIVRFSTIGPVKAGWLQKDKGVWTVTEEGVKALSTYEDPAQFMREASRLYRVWKKGQPEAEGLEEAAEEQIASTLEEAQESAWNEIRAYLAVMSPYDLQDLVAALLEAMNYHVAWVAPPGPDRGLDILAFEDPLGASGPRIKVQVKRRADKVTADGLRSFLAVLGDGDIGLFISLGGFTSDAHMEARMQERRRITLLDAGKLVDLWVENYPRVDESARQLLPLRPVYFLAPAIEIDSD